MLKTTINMKKLTGLFAILGFIMFMGILASCESQGTLKQSESTLNTPCVIGGDTLDLYVYWPSSMRSIYVAKIRNSSKPVTSLTYTEGKADQSIIIIDKDKKTNTVINGSVISENDSIVIKKK